MDNGSHVFDVATYLFGGLDRVHASILLPVQNLGVEDSAHLRFIVSGAVMGSSSLSWSVAAADDRYLQVQCSRGSIMVGWRGAYVKLDGHPSTNGIDSHAFAGPYDKMAAHRSMYLQLRDAIGLGGPLWIRPEECVQISAAVRAAYRSIVSDGWEYVEGEPRARAALVAQPNLV
jgi:predicted dehydrogenase